MTEHQWHLDRRVPIGLIFAIVLQTIALGYWLGNLNSRVTAIENNRYTDARGSVAEERITQNERRIERIEERMLAALARNQRSLDRIHLRMDLAGIPNGGEATRGKGAKLPPVDAPFGSQDWRRNKDEAD